ncbi:MAG: hypothetical protein S4CHLAM37_02670 [Chlamydiia bacterium]|nr:hypothetical protein [Chlamydiia bacterium]
MSTIEEIITAPDSLYSGGLLFAPSYYKESIEESRYSEIVTDASRNNAFYGEVVLDLAKRVATIAIIVIPSITILPAGSVLSLVGSGALAALISSSSSQEEKRPPHTFEVLSLKADLLACMKNKDKAHYFTREILVNAALKTVYLGLITYTYPTFLASFGLFSIGMSYGNELLSFLDAGMEEYFKRVRLPQLEEELRLLD